MEFELKVVCIFFFKKKIWYIKNYNYDLKNIFIYIYIIYICK